MRLNDPSATAVRDAFAALPRQGCLEAVCGWERRLEVLAALEECGAFAIRIEPREGFSSVRVVALKGNAGPCYDTGRSAVYRGGAAAVLDDDRHLIVGTLRVCEKTGGLYTLWPYREVLSVTGADPELLARLDSEPVPFDCNTFDADSQRLAEMLENTRRSTLNAPCSTVVYPGPFRALVLKDGAVVRRGVASLVPEAQAGQNGLLRLPLGRAQDATPCETYAKACRERGTAFILEPLGRGLTCVTEGAETVSSLDGAALAALRAAPRDFKQRLLQLIDAREPYLVLTGSDPDVPGGCCPSTQVGVANRLVKAGALQSSAPPAPPESCTVTFYAFPGEIVGEDNGSPDFHLCERVREQAATALRDDRWDGVKRAARMGLLVLLGVSLGLSAWRTLALPTARSARLCAACEAASEISHRLAGNGPVNTAGAAALGALAAVQPCALALLAGAVALASKPGAGMWTSIGRSGLLATGAGLSNAALAMAVAWGFSRAFGGMANGVQVFAGPLMVLAGLPLTGLFRVPARKASGIDNIRGSAELFLLGAALGVLWCPVGAGLFVGVLLPAALPQGTAVRNTALYEVGYTASLFVVSAFLTAVGRLALVRAVGRVVSVVAGWYLIVSGVALAMG